MNLRHVIRVRIEQIIAIGLLLMAIPCIVDGQYSTVKLLGVTIEGLKTADPAIIQINSGLTQGKEITADDIQTAIKNLWSLNLFSDVEIYQDKELPGGIYVTIRVKEYPRLEKYELVGNKKLKKEDIDKELSFYRGQVVSPYQINKARKKLKKLYADKGYLLAEITAETYEAEKDGKTILTFNIKEGEKVQIKKINFAGNENISSSKLRKQMKKTKEDRWWRGADFNRKEYEKDLMKVVEYYQNHGFRDAEILSDSVYYDENRKDLYIDIVVREGERYYIGDISFVGNKIYGSELLQSQLGFAKGDAYSREKIQKAIMERLGTLYYDNGYIYSRIDPRETPVARDTVDIQFNITEGQPVKINLIHIAGNTKTKEKVVRRELRINPGDIFSKAALERSQRDVWVLNYFSDVKIDYWPVSDDQIDLKFTVEEKSTDLANMSAGWSERDKIIGNIGVAMNNLFGNGQQLSFDWNFGRYYRSFQIGFTEPWLMDTPTLAGFTIYDTKRDAQYIGYSQRSSGGQIRLGRRLRWPDNYFRGDIIYRIDRTELGDFSPYVIAANPNNIVGQEWPLTSSSITQIISRNSLNRPEFPTDGSEVSFSAEFAGGFLGGNVGYHKYTFAASWFTPAIWKLVLYNHAMAGYLDGWTKTSKIPYLEYFFLGGEGMTRSTPLRGYDDPLAGYATSPGGKVMLKYTTELRFPIIPNPTMFGLIFAEAGNSWVNISDTDPFDLRRSVGIGARLFMPMIGIIGFDYAYGFDNYDVNGRRYGKWKPHFVFGRSF
ncbi:MAG: outer membrane protein assembly factor BamA [candidate division KSB1 bacterium]|nr:outer membrane protein assembly factor BamA [candidate division KSB1 bacterium]MDZ7334455.1 outer membrane protein assembly factor BamA [candidate division KSB1 bacterium]MDZ7355982.1 outer membrane protein assembly factor BamA [candidate division KSB1 bacterium]MDZ7400684.1 outer membrane protein assembly factor BamA [candidate division KSB1 bacterium]